MNFAFRLSALRPAAQAIGVLALLLVLTGTWYLRTYFGAVTPDQLLFHLEHGGLDYVDPRLLWRTVRWGIGMVLLTALSLWVLGRLSRSARRWAWLGLGVAAAASVGATVADPCLPDPRGDDFLAQHYVDPAALQLTLPPGSAAQRPDILLVFVESLDQAYTRTANPAEPLLPRLTALQQSFQTFGEMRNLSGATWTMGGLFTALCGLPLGRVGLMSHNSLEYAPRFFRGGQCLTDLLAAHGWETTFYGGASLRFAGKGQFLADHAVARRFGREQWRAMGVPTPEEGWGLLDNELAERAWHDMNRPRVNDAPRLNLLLTVNTHGPMGAHDPGCANGPAAGLGLLGDAAAATVPEGDWARQLEDPDEAHIARNSPAARALMRNALRCTDAVVAQLVTRFATQADGRAKVIWIMGDHLNPQPLLTADLAAVDAPRTVFHAMARFDGLGRLQSARDVQRQFSHVDVLPTLAEAAGLRWGVHPHRLGLGVSLLAPHQPPTLVEAQGFDHTNGRLSCSSPLFQALWFGARTGT